MLLKHQISNKCTNVSVKLVIHHLELLREHHSLPYIVILNTLYIKLFRLIILEYSRSHVQRLTVPFCYML